MKAKAVSSFMWKTKEQHQNIKLFSKKNKIAIDNEFLLELEKFTEVQYDLN